jgi:hypothetical protein
MRDSGEVPGSLERVLATEGKTPLKDAATSSPQRTKKTTERSKVSRNRIIAGSVGAVVLLGGIFFLTRGGDSPFSSDEAPSGPVQFQLKGATYIPYQLQGDQNAQKATAHQAGTEIQAQLDALFEKSYVNPGSWGDTGEIEDFFAEGAMGSLEANVDKLTLGTNAGDTYERVDPGKSTLKVSVLTGADGSPVRASARLTFSGLATHTDGTYSAITVTGTAIFVKDGDTWKIEAYDLERREKQAQSPAPSVSPTSEAS